MIFCNNCGYARSNTGINPDYLCPICKQHQWNLSLLDQEWIDHRNGECIACGGHGYFTAEPAFIYGAGKIKCKECNGTGLLQKPTQCSHCGAVKLPKEENKLDD